METLGDKIKKMRIESNLKQNDLAEILCVSEKTISSWENDRTKPDLNMIYKLSDYFKKSFYYLINDDLNLENTNEMQIKLKVDEKNVEKVRDFVKEMGQVFIELFDYTLINDENRLEMIERVKTKKL